MKKKGKLDVNGSDIQFKSISTLCLIGNNLYKVSPPSLISCILVDLENKVLLSRTMILLDLLALPYQFSSLSIFIL